MLACMYYTYRKYYEDGISHFPRGQAVSNIMICPRDKDAMHHDAFTVFYGPESRRF